MAVSEEECSTTKSQSSPSSASVVAPSRNVHYLAKCVLKGSVVLHVAYGHLRSPSSNDVVFGKIQLFSFPQIQLVKLRNNSFNGTLDFGGQIGPQLQLIDLENNKISALALSSGHENSNYTLNLAGNPLCTQSLSNVSFCQLGKPYSTSLAQCGGKSCPSDKKFSPQNCECAYPYEGELNFRAPSFRDLSNVNLFHALEMSLGATGAQPWSSFSAESILQY